MVSGPLLRRWPIRTGLPPPVRTQPRLKSERRSEACGVFRAVIVRVRGGGFGCGLLIRILFRCALVWNRFRCWLSVLEVRRVPGFNVPERIGLPCWVRPIPRVFSGRVARGFARIVPVFIGRRVGTLPVRLVGGRAGLRFGVDRGGVRVPARRTGARPWAP